VAAALASALAVFGSAFVVAFAVTTVGRHRQTHSWPSRAPFLGGGSPDTHAWSRFHARYYPMALVFVAFEMEMMFMYPWAVVYVHEGVTALADMGVFLGLLSLGLVYAWREGAFRWQ
jgi:NADH-quinone oxidoreductase subunit A